MYIHIDSIPSPVFSIANNEMIWKWKPPTYLLESCTDLGHTCKTWQKRRLQLETNARSVNTMLAHVVQKSSMCPDMPQLGVRRMNMLRECENKPASRCGTTLLRDVQQHIPTLDVKHTLWSLCRSLALYIWWLRCKAHMKSIQSSIIKHKAPYNIPAR